MAPQQATEAKQPRVYKYEPKPCAECGKPFRGAGLRCNYCRATPRDCAECGRNFRGTQRLCPICVKTERTCKSCGQAFRGTGYTCRPCSYAVKLTRTCLDCGIEFESNGCRKCWRCRQPLVEKPCEACGKTFKGSARRCYPCRTVEITCACGRVFRDKGSRKTCQRCRKKPRECVSCGTTFVGARRKCAPCEATRRTCVDCGKEYKSRAKRCGRCYWQAQPYEKRSAMALIAVNKRRALQMDAAIFGPVPLAAYDAIRAADECVYCGEPPAHVDHVRPLARGGWEHESNLVPACAYCNQSKGAKLLTEWDRERVMRGAVFSEKVAAEYARLLAMDDQLALPL